MSQTAGQCCFARIPQYNSIEKLNQHKKQLKKKKNRGINIQNIADCVYSLTPCRCSSFMERHCKNCCEEWQLTLGNKRLATISGQTLLPQLCDLKGTYQYLRPPSASPLRCEPIHCFPFNHTYLFILCPIYLVIIRNNTVLEMQIAKF